MVGGSGDTKPGTGSAAPSARAEAPGAAGAADRRGAFRAVCVGGGNGVGQVIRGLLEYTRALTGVIAVTDSGRSTGIVRSVMRIPAPGDLRNTLVMLSEADPLLRDLFQHRLVSQRLAEFNGVAFGNLFLGALAQMTGSFERAVAETSRLLRPAAQILPVTLTDTHLCAELLDNSLRFEEVSVRGLSKPPIKRVFLRDEAEIYPPAREALLQADLITIGPGSLFTTVLACLVVREVPEAIAEAHSRGARVMYVCNTTSQPGQTDGFTCYDHVAEIDNALGDGVLDLALLNTGVPPDSVVERHRRSGLYLLAVSPEEVHKIEALGVRVVAAPLIESGAEERVLWNKQDTLRHDSALVSRELVQALFAPLPQAVPEARPQGDVVPGRQPGIQPA